MEALSMLKYWRGSGGGGGGHGEGVVDVKTAAVAVVEDEEEENDDEGPFFDLEFAVPEGDEVVVEEESDEEEKEDEVFGFAVSSGGSSDVDVVDVCEGDGDGDVTDVAVSLSPSEDLFFKGRLVPLEQVESGNSKPAGGGQFPAVSLLKSATKFRVFLLGLKKSRHATTSTVSKASERPTSSPAVAKTPPMGTPGQHEGKLFTVKFKVEEVPIISLFTRDNSSKTSSFKSAKPVAGDGGASDAKRLVNKYLKMIKPLYVRVSRRHTEKLKLEPAAEQQSSPPAPTPAPAPSSTATSSPTGSTSIAGMIKSSSNVSLPAGLRVVCKHLGKSRSASSAAVLPAVTDGQSSSQRRDDSLMQQQDSIQSAILHCKRSFNASTDGAAKQAVPAARCGGGNHH